MSVEDVYLEPHVYGKPFGTVIRVAASSESTRMNFEVSLPDFLDALSNCVDYLDDFMKKELLARAQNAWDESVISDSEFAAFKRVTEMIL